MSDISTLDRQITSLMDCKPLTEEEVQVLCDKAREVLIEESNVQRVDAPVTVCVARLPHRSNMLPDTPSCWCGLCFVFETPP